jgi:hypothetical protein
MQGLLYNMCRNEPRIAEAVQRTYDSYLAKLAAQPPVDFDHYSKSCWHTLNKKYARLRPSQQYELIGDIIGELSDARTSIMEKAGPATRFETRRNALEVLRKISKSVMLCQEQEIRHELMKDGMLLAELSESMLELAKGMTRNEREKYRGEGLYAKLIELQGECDAADMEGLADVYAVFDEHEEVEVKENVDGDAEVSVESITAPPIPSPAVKRTKVFSVGELS